MTNDDLFPFFSEDKLYGDDFTLAQIKEWYQDEQEAFTDMYIRPEGEHYQYPYHSLDRYHAYRYLPADFQIDHALGIGSAIGDEFRPIVNRIRQITILEPSDLYRNWDNVGGTSARWVKPEISGDIKFSDNTFDLITCFSVLHHIPNVSHVISECVRVLKPGCFLLIREPITSMGDWRVPRKGVTKRERGIPWNYFRRILADKNLDIVYESPCNFPVIDIGTRKLFRSHPYNSFMLTRMDAFLSRIFSWNYRYHRTSFFQKIAPRSICFVIQKLA